MQIPWPTLSYKVLVCQLKQKLIDAIQSVCHFYSTCYSRLDDSI